MLAALRALDRALAEEQVTKRGRRRAMLAAIAECGPEAAGPRVGTSDQERP